VSSRSLLDAEYARGRWAYLESLRELPRYAVISAYCAHRRSAVSVLDLGCGTGVLRRWLRPELLADYVGVDLSEVAIQCARREVKGVGTFVAADVATFEPSRRFDVIIFNEVLYYFVDPGNILRPYASALEKDGVFIISLWESPESHRAWRCAADAVTVADAVEIRSESKVAWRIRLCNPACS
jgi:2-polyprenyl-6-hydroxyphenyl methylase/3-demethylubiquinone-9 3-methyltransferase